LFDGHEDAEKGLVPLRQPARAAIDGHRHELPFCICDWEYAQAEERAAMSNWGLRRTHPINQKAHNELFPIRILSFIPARILASEFERAARLA
jgi:hypothetical protein